jgi:hypothetical protein
MIRVAGVLWTIFSLRLAPPKPLRSRGLNLTLETAPSGSSAKGLILLRIQKTGTTTFGDRIMNRQCAAHGIPCDVYWHIDWDWAAKLPYFKDRAIATWIRDPVERVFSEYQYVRNVGASQQVQWDYTPQQQKLVAKADTFEKFLNIPDNPASNRMTRYLLGFARPRTVSCPRDCDPVWAQFLNKEELESPGSQIRVAKESGATDGTILMVAKQRLDKSIPLLGVTDCFDESLTLLGTQLGWSVPNMLADAKVHYRAGGRNATAQTTAVHRLQIPPRVAELALAKNALDLQVFRYALILVNQRLASVAPHLKCVPQFVKAAR